MNVEDRVKYSERHDISCTMANRIVTGYLQGGLDDLFNGEEGTLTSCTYQSITWLEETPSKNRH